jgi:hypothetical protein
MTRRMKMKKRRRILPMKQPSNRVTEIDKNLSMLREAWMDAKPEKKSSWIAKIDAALDERLKATKEET